MCKPFSGSSFRSVPGLLTATLLAGLGLVTSPKAQAQAPVPVVSLSAAQDEFRLQKGLEVVF